MTAPKATPPTLNVGDTLVLKEALADGWWQVELNGVSTRILIGRVKSIKRQKSSDEKEKVLPRQSSKKDASLNGLLNATQNSLPPDSIAHPRNQAATTGSIVSHTVTTLGAPTSPRTYLDLRISPRPAEEETMISPKLPPPISPSIIPEDTIIDVELPSAPIPTTKPEEGSGSTGTMRKSRSTKREKSGGSKLTTRGSKTHLKNDLLSIALDIEASHTDLSLIVRTLELEAGVKLPNETSTAEAQILFQLTKEQRFLDKMLEGSYMPLFNTSGQLKAGIALAPLRLLAASELLVPPVNMAALSTEEKLTLQHLDFNVFPYKDTYNEHHVRLLLMAMFYEFDLPRIFQIPDVTLYRFFTVVSRKYRQVPFHNFFHAFNVTQTMYFFLKTGLASRVLGPLEIMACLVAAICHDLDHPGLNNDFQRKAQTRVYHMHKKSVLENHHYLQYMASMANTESNILANLTSEDEDLFDSYVRDLILATDLAVHGIILKSLTERKKILAKYVKAGSPVGMNDEDRKLVMVSLMKCADLSNEVRENSISKSWAKLVMEEFFAQSDLERTLNLPVTPFMDKEKIIITKEQINFIEKLCLPLYTQLAGVFPEIERCCIQLEQNRATWQDRLRLFFSSPEELKKLSNKSIWEREQLKTKGGNLSVSSTLSMLASKSPMPGPGSRRTSKAPIPSGQIIRDASHTSTGSAASSSTNVSGAASTSSNSSLTASTSSLAPAPGTSGATLASSISSPDVSVKKDRKGLEDKSKDDRSLRESKADRTKEASRTVSSGPAVPSKTPKK